MTTHTFAEAVNASRSQLDQYLHRRRLRAVEADDDEAPAVEKHFGKVFPSVTGHQGQLTPLEAIEELQKDKLAFDAMKKRDRFTLREAKEQLAARRRPLPENAREFARRVKGNF
jgi:hypothetical protein